MAKQSKYNTILLIQAKALKSFATGESDTVDLSQFKEVGVRKHWGDSATIVETTDGKVIVQGTINSHIIAIGKVLAAFGYRGEYHLTSKLQLVRVKPEEPTWTTIEDILAAAA